MVSRECGYWIYCENTCWKYISHFVKNVFFQLVVLQKSFDLGWIEVGSHCQHKQTTLFGKTNSRETTQYGCFSLHPSAIALFIPKRIAPNGKQTSLIKLKYISQYVIGNFNFNKQGSTSTPLRQVLALLLEFWICMLLASLGLINLHFLVLRSTTHPCQKCSWSLLWCFCSILSKAHLSAYYCAIVEVCLTTVSNIHM